MHLADASVFLYSREPQVTCIILIRAYKTMEDNNPQKGLFDSSKRLAPLFILVDGYSLLFRAFHSMGDMKASDGTPTGALFGLTSMLIKAIQDHQPDYLVVAFDFPAKTFRHEAYPEYKAHRDHAPDELKQQMVISRDLVKVMGIDYRGASRL